MRRKPLFMCTGLILVIVMLAVPAVHPTNEIAVQSAGVTDALKASFGSSVEAVTGFQPFYVTGDFNGDAIQDIAIAVRIREQRTALPKDVRLLNPFYGKPKVTYPSTQQVKTRWRSLSFTVGRVRSRPRSFC